MTQKIMKVFTCDFCKKKYFVKSAALRHETELCFSNPINKRPCLSCPYLTKKNAYEYVSYANPYGSEDEVTRSLFYCSKKEIFLHLPQSKTKGNVIEIEGGEIENNPMPLSCPVYDALADTPF